MASNTITTTRTINFAGPPEAARAAMEKAMVGRKGKIIEGDGDLSAKFGSQLMLRLVGGWLMPTKSFPVRATAEFAPTSEGTEISLTVGDAMGIGTKAGMKGKYERAVDEVAGDLVTATSA